jgi:hypothetical protein
MTTRRASTSPAPFVDARTRRTGSKDASGDLAAKTVLRPARSATTSTSEESHMTEPTEAEIYAQYFDAKGQPVRAGVQLTAEESREYAKYFADTTATTNEETN